VKIKVQEVDKAVCNNDCYCQKRIWL
jgi:hypothetical protein